MIIVVGGILFVGIGLVMLILAYEILNDISEKGEESVYGGGLVMFYVILGIALLIIGAILIYSIIYSGAMVIIDLLGSYFYLYTDNIKNRLKSGFLIE